MEKNTIVALRVNLSALFLIAGMVLLLSLVSVTNPELAAGETIGQWVWFDKAAIVAAVCILIGLLLLPPGGDPIELGFCLSMALMIWGGVEAVWGLCQLYGFAASGHARYALTGSFFNPGPYAGFLAMVLPICVYHWISLLFSWSALELGMKIEKCLAVGVTIGILCVLPATMSRSAWLAATISCVWVYGTSKGWASCLRHLWCEHKPQVIKAAIGMLIALTLAGGLLFWLKPDSAKGRLFMWKIACQTVAENPIYGHGAGRFAGAYGNTQEDYFAKGDYASWEEHVAGSPEYAFNEYLYYAVEAGLPITVTMVFAIMTCLAIGLKKQRWGVCAAVFSLLIFAFSSYPFQLPIFIITFIGLLVACIIGTGFISWIVVAIGIGASGALCYNSDSKTYDACREWSNTRVLYHAGAYEAAEKEYEQLYPILRDRAAFLFEYGHCLHKQEKAKKSNSILEQALRYSSDPMVLNILGKNCQQMGNYWAAEDWFIRSTHRLPGRIYPYYLLAKLYAEPGFYQPENFEKMKRIVLTKDPKVNSTAIREMKEELIKLSNETLKPIK